MNEIEEKLTHRVGPLPVWGWGAVVAGSVVVFLYIRKAHKPVPATQQTGAGFGDSTAGGGGGSGGVTTTTQPPTPAVPVAIPPSILPSIRIGTVESPLSPGHDQGVPPSEDTVDLTWQPKVVAPITKGEEAAIKAGASTPAIATKIIANNIAQTINDVAAQVGATNKLIAVNVGTAGATDAQNEQERQQIATALVAKGYTSSSYGGQVYAAQNSTDYWNGLPPAARQNLAQLLVNMGLARGKKS